MSASSSERARYRVSTDRGRGHLAVGTILEEVDRFDGWDYHGCIDPMVTVVVRLQVVSGERRGDVIEVGLASGCEDEHTVVTTTWLTRTEPGDPSGGSAPGGPGGLIP